MTVPNIYGQYSTSITTIFSTINLHSTTQPLKNKKHHTSNKNPPVHCPLANISTTIRGIGPRSSRLQAKNPLPKHGYSRTLAAPHPLPYENTVRPTPVAKYWYLANLYIRTPRIRKAKSSGFSIRYSEVTEEVPYSEDRLYGSGGCKFPEGSFVIARFPV